MFLTSFRCCPHFDWIPCLRHLYVVYYRQTWRHAQNRKCITYRNAVRERMSHWHRYHAVEIWQRLNMWFLTCAGNTPLPYIARRSNNEIEISEFRDIRKRVNAKPGETGCCTCVWDERWLVEARWGRWWLAGVKWIAARRRRWWNPPASQWSTDVQTLRCKPIARRRFLGASQA